MAVVSPARRTHRRAFAVALAVMAAGAVLAGGLFVQLVGSGGARRSPVRIGLGGRAAPAGKGPTTTTPAGTITYQVKRGDTLTGIAARFAVTVPELVALNHLADADHVSVGETLLVPTRAPILLVVLPEEGHAGDTFLLHLFGARPSETITFEIVTPQGTYAGPPHTAHRDGTVETTYQSALTDPPGSYTVVVHGDQGTIARVGFVLDPPSPTTTTGA